MRSAVVVIASLLVGCRPPAPVGPARDWAAAPAFAQPAESPGRVWVVSDVHGGYQRLITLLKTAGLVNDALTWTGGADRLYVLGDLIDKTTGGIPTIELLQSLEAQAPATGGLVVVSLGNHEAEFLADPAAEKVATFATELRERALDPLEVAKGAGPGAWLRSRPFGIKDGAWFFSHSGHTGGRTLDDLALRLARGIDAEQYAADVVAAPDSIVEAEQWWASSSTDSATLIDTHLTALGARHIVFGHDPGAFGKKGAMAEKLMGRLFLVDVGMSPTVNDSPGALLLIERGAVTTVNTVAADGSRKLLFQE